ncbi:MAG: hypothetical protein NTW14_08200 [bacterium]|nr:hypothetical protein [bacterium]
MEPSAILKTLQDPMGIPFYPILFQILAVLTFSLHIMFVNFTVGTLSLSVYGHFRSDPSWKQLSRSMARAVLPNVSTAIVFAIAPLLFVQVLYDPNWYSSNSLIAAWSITFLFAMMIGYSFVYVFYLGRLKTDGKGYTLYGILALGLFLLAGVIIHSISVGLIQPEKWLSWYVRNGTVDVTGAHLHAFQLSRFLHFIVPAFVMTGIFLMLYNWYFRSRDDMDQAHLNWVGSLGAKLAFYAALVEVVIGFWWLFEIPGKFKFYFNHFFLLGVVISLYLLHYLYKAAKNPVKAALPSAFIAFVLILVMAYTREMLRMKYLGEFGYSIFNYPVNVDWASTLLFLLSFVLGLVVLIFLLKIAFDAGRKSGVVSFSDGIMKWGKLSIGLLVLWIVAVATLGIITVLKNAG